MRITKSALLAGALPFLLLVVSAHARDEGDSSYQEFHIPGVGPSDDAWADTIIRWYANDPEFDAPPPRPLPVDTDLGQEAPSAHRAPGFAFAGANLEDGWIFQGGDGYALETSTPSASGALRMTHASPLPSTILYGYVGIWTDYDVLDTLANGDLVALRAAISSDVANRPEDASKPRLRLTPDPQPNSGQVPSTQGIDFGYQVNENDANSPFLPTLNAPGRTYVAYSAMPAHGTAGRHGVAWDHHAAQASGGLARTVSLHSLEVAVVDAAAFTGSATPISSGSFTSGGFKVGQVDGWNYKNLDGLGVFGGLTFWRDGASDTSGGRIGHADTNNLTYDVGGVAFFNAGDPNSGGGTDLIEYTAGAIYLNSFDVVSSDSDPGRPMTRLDVRPLDPSLQQSYTLRHQGDHWLATDPGPATYDLVWTAPDNGSERPATNDLIIGFDLFNVNSDRLHGGASQLDAARYSEIAPSDPNNP